MDVFFQMPSFVTILDFVGTFAFAISGIRLASAKRFDWFGAYVVGLATAIGGGTIRDLLLDVTPAWMTDPMYLICTAFAMFFVILFGKYVIRLNNTFFIFDTIGLALFTIVGFSKAYTLGYPFWIAIIMGSITGAAGGVLRDIFINEILCDWWTGLLDLSDAGYGICACTDYWRNHSVCSPYSGSQI